MNRSTAFDPRPIRTLWWCALAIAISFVVLSLARTRLSHEPDRVFAIDSIWPSDQKWDDSWMPMNVAFDYIRAPHATPIYSKVFVEQHIKFQYPLTSLLIMYLARSSRVLNGISLALILLACPLMVSLFNRFLAAATRLAPDFRTPESAMERAGRIALPVLMTLTFYPVVYSYRLGQLQTWLFFAFVLMVWLWTQGWIALAGVIAGLLTCAKPQFALLFIWGATRKRWSFCGAFAVTALIIVGITTALWGVRDQLNYLTVLSVLSRHGESWWANQSVNGTLHRMLDASVATDWQHYYLPPFNRIIYFGTLISSVALIAGALFVPVKFRGGVADLMLASLTFTIASPVAWTHHYSIMLPMYAALFAWATQQRPLGRWTLPTLCLSYLLLGTFLGAFWKIMQTKLSFVQSYPFAGVLIGLGLLYFWTMRGEPQTVSADKDSNKAASTGHPVHEGMLPRPLTV